MAGSTRSCWQLAQASRLDLVAAAGRPSAGLLSPLATRRGPRLSLELVVSPVSFALLSPLTPFSSKQAAQRKGGLQGGRGNRLKGSVSGERLCRLCAPITLRAVDSDLEFAVSKVADLPDEGRAYVEHVTTPDPLRKRSGGSQTSSELAMARASALRA